MNLNDIWVKLVYAFKTNDKRFYNYIDEFKKYDIQWLKRLRQELLDNDRVVAFSILNTLTEDEKIELFDLMVYFSSFTHGSTSFFRDLIVGLPREWVIKNIEAYANPMLETNNEDVYRRILELYSKLDYGLALHLAKHASKSSDPAIKEVGDEFITDQ